MRKVGERNGVKQRMLNHCRSRSVEVGVEQLWRQSLCVRGYDVAAQEMSHGCHVIGSGCSVSRRKTAKNKGEKDTARLRPAQSKWSRFRCHTRAPSRSLSPFYFRCSHSPSPSTSLLCTSRNTHLSLSSQHPCPLSPRHAKQDGKHRSEEGRFKDTCRPPPKV